MEHNDVAVRPAKHHVILGDGPIYKYGEECPISLDHSIRRTCVLRAPSACTLWPGEYIEITLPGGELLP